MQEFELYSHPSWLDGFSLVVREQIERFMATGHGSNEFFDWLDSNPDVKELIDGETSRRIGES